MAILVVPAGAADNEAVAEALTTLFQSGHADLGSPQTNSRVDKVYGFYQARKFKPIWTRDNGPKVKAAALLVELKRSAAHGLSPSFYGVDEIAGLMASRDPVEIAKLELLLSAAVIEFGEDLRNGRIGPDDAGSENAVEPVPVDAVALIEGAETADNLGAFASTLLTADFRYVRLIAKVAEFSRIQASGQWPAIDGKGAEVAAGGSDPRVKAVRKLLALSGDLALSEMEGGSTLDPNVAAALRSYQTRNGLAPSGVMDAATLATMSMPLDDIIRKIKLNLERRRWQNRDLGDDYVYINLADRSLKLVKAGNSSDGVAVENTEQLRTLPTFFGAITGVEAGPDVPGGIALTVQSPFIHALASQGIADTVAIADPAALARELLDGDAAEGATVGGLLAAKSPMRMAFDKPVQLFVTYVTAWANGDGSVEFRPDIFGRDAPLAAMLQLK